MILPKRNAKNLREQIKNSSRRKLKFFAKKIEIVREQSEKSSRTFFLFVLAESLNALISPLQLGLNVRFLLLSSFRFSPSSPLVPPAHM